jgi:hypothetical protein
MDNSTQRKLLSKEEINQVVELWKQSGKTKKSFADEQGLKYVTFTGWCKRHGRKKIVQKSTPEKFIPIEVKQEPSIFAELEFSAGQKIVFYQSVTAEYLKTLLK